MDNNQYKVLVMASKGLPELEQCRKTPTSLYQGCCAHDHSSSQRKMSQYLLQPTAE